MAYRQATNAAARNLSRDITNLTIQEDEYYDHYYDDDDDDGDSRGEWNDLLEADKANNNQVTCGNDPHVHFDSDTSLCSRIREELNQSEKKLSVAHEDPCIRLNVGGGHYMLLRSNLKQQPNTALGKVSGFSHRHLLNICDLYIEDTREYFFDRSAILFEEIANFYRTGKLHAPENVCKSSFKQELKFWDIPSSIECCDHKNKKGARKDSVARRISNTRFSLARTRVGNSKRPRRTMRQIKTLTMEQKGKVLYSGQRCKEIRMKIWMGMEQPFSSILGAFLGATSLFFIFATIVLLILGSLPEYQVSVSYSSNNSFLAPCKTCETVMLQQFGANSTNGSYKLNKDASAAASLFKEVHPYIELADLICALWFTIEYLVRLWAAPKALKFISSPLSIIDLLSFLPFYGEVLAKSLCLCDSIASFTRSMTALRVLRILRVFRVVRVLKLARFSIGIQLIGKALKHSIPELAMLATFVFIVTILFSTVMYYVENTYDGSDFSSIPQSCWWCIVTFTTVGYGDIVPKTILGKIVAGVVSFCGVVVLAFPISIIVDKFNRTYTDVKSTMVSPPELHTSKGVGDASVLDDIKEVRKPKKRGLKFVY